MKQPERSPQVGGSYGGPAPLGAAGAPSSGSAAAYRPGGCIYFLFISYVRDRFVVEAGFVTSTHFDFPFFQR